MQQVLAHVTPNRGFIPFDSRIAALRCCPGRPQLPSSHLRTRLLPLSAQKQEREVDDVSVPDTPPASSSTNASSSKSSSRDQSGLEASPQDEADRQASSLNFWESLALYNFSPIAEATASRTDSKDVEALEGCETSDDSGWGITDWSQYGRKWDVPWDAKITYGGMALWFATFMGTSLVLFPTAFFTFMGPGQQPSKQALSYFVLGNQVLETGLSLGVIALLTKGFRKEARSAGLFRFSLE